MTTDLPIPVQLIVFDLGGVMVRLQPSWAAAFGAAGLPVPTRLGEVDLAKQVSDLVNREEQGLLGKTGFFSSVASLLGVRDVELEAVSSRYLIEPYPGVDDLLDELASSGVQTACLSNTNAHHWEVMTGSGPAALPLHRLHYRFASHELGCRKPDPAIYERVVRDTGVAPEAVVFFDDREENIQAALAAGWHAHVIDPAADPMAQCRMHLAGYDLT